MKCKVRGREISHCWFMLLFVLSMLGCRETREVKLVTYSEFGPEFLPQVLERFALGGGEAKECSMVYVIWALETKLPAPDGNRVDFKSVLCACEGKYASGKPLWRMMHLERRDENGVITWPQAGRIAVDAEGGFGGARLYPAKPTIKEIEYFIERAQLEKELEYRCQKLQYTRNNTHTYYVKAKAYPEECKELYGSIPTCLKNITRDWHADEPYPYKLDEKKAAGRIDPVK